MTLRSILRRRSGFFLKCLLRNVVLMLLKQLCLKKLNDRKDDATSVGSKSFRSKATTSRLSRWNHTKIFSDFGDESEDNSDMEPETVTSRRSASKFNTKASAARSWAKEEANIGFLFIIII